MATSGGRRPAVDVPAMLRTLYDDLWNSAPDPQPIRARLPQAGLVALVVLSYVLFPGGQPGSGALGMVVVGLQVAALAVALFRPVTAWWVVTIGGVAGALTLRQGMPWGYPAIALQAGVQFLLAQRVRPRIVSETLAVTVLAYAAAAGLHPSGGSPADLAAMVLYTDAGRGVALLALASLAGSVLRARRVARGQLRVQAEIAAEERARRTLLEERGRIARELHDVVAHHLSVISIQAQVAPHLVDGPSAALTDNLTGIRQNALAALVELRRVLSVLRLDDPRSEAAARHAPQPTLARLDDLLANVRAAGVVVAGETAGEPRPLSPGVELSAFRLIQEALSNAMRHAPGAPVRVAIAYDPANLTVRVANDPPDRPALPSPDGGHGLLGMRERIAMLGGELTVGPTPDGGYEVTAVVPAPTAAEEPVWRTSAS